jgi:hypothetical protein
MHGGESVKKPFKITALTIGLFLISTGQSQASSVVYEDVELFQGETFFTDSFVISDPGTYLATLTDFEFPAPMTDTGMSLTTATDLLGSLMAPGTFTFDATPGDYYVSFFGFADSSTSTRLGQYGIEISLQTSPVPVPAAIWLFASGLIGLIGISRRKVSA